MLHSIKVENQMTHLVRMIVALPRNGRTMNILNIKQGLLCDCYVTTVLKYINN